MIEEELGSLYNKIAETVIDTIPEEWDKVYLYGEVIEGAQTSYFYYFPKGSEQPIYSEDIIEHYTVSEEEYFQKWHRLLNYIRELREVFIDEEQEPWTNFTMIFDNSGKFKIDFNYDDLTNVNSHERETIWNYKHLGIIPKSKSGKRYLEKYFEDLKTEKKVSNV